MRLSEVLFQLPWEDVCLALQQFCPARNAQLDRFEAAYRSLRAMQPTESDMCILAVLDPGEPAVHVFGINGTPFSGQEGVPKAQRVPARFNLSATDWQEWLGMDVSEDYRQQFSASEIAAHCLWEMTYFGFSPEQIQRRISGSPHENQP